MVKYKARCRNRKARTRKQHDTGKKRHLLDSSLCPMVGDARLAETPWLVSSVGGWESAEQRSKSLGRRGQLSRVMDEEMGLQSPPDP